MQLVDLGGDAPHRRRAPIGQEKGGMGMLEKGIVLGLEVEFALQQQGRHPIGIVPIEREGQMMEIVPLLLGLNRHDFHGCAQETDFPAKFAAP